MSSLDDPNLDPENEGGQSDPQGARARIRALIAENKTLTEQAAKAEHLERELALRDAGLDLNERQRKALAATHDGEWTSERIRETALDLGFTVPSPPPVVPAAETAAGTRIDQASAGAAIGSGDVQADIDARLRNATTEREFDAIYRESGRPMR